MFVYRLADRLGYANPDAMLREMEPHQLVEWRAYLDGTTAADDWRQAGTISAAVTNGFGQVLQAFGGKVEDVEPEDFIPKIQPDDGLTPAGRRALARGMDDSQIAGALRGAFGGRK